MKAGFYQKKEYMLRFSENRSIYPIFFLPNFSTTFMLRFCKTAAYVAQNIRFFPLVLLWKCNVCLRQDEKQ